VSLKAPLSDEDKDTEADSPESEDNRRRRLTRRVGRRAPTKSSEASEETVIDDGPPIKAVATGKLSDVLRHETSVRRRASTLADRRPSSSSGKRAAFEIELARSIDSSQQIERISVDRVVISGIATGPLDDGDRAPTVSLLVDGTLYAVGVESGDTAAETAARLAARLSRALRVEVVDASVDSATLVLLGNSPR